MNSTMSRTSGKTLGLVQIALFSAIIFLLALVPGLGYIPVGVIRATTIHIPVIIGSLVLGPKAGAALGGMFGLTSLINNTISPTVTSFVFSPVLAADMGGGAGVVKSLVICFLPRILIGVVPYFVYRFFKHIAGKGKISDTVFLGIAGLAGSMTNTLCVMNLIYFLFGADYANARGASMQGFYSAVILPVIGINGVIEAVVAAIIATAVVSVFYRTRLVTQKA